MIVERAPAKINLALHVTGVREDGYHELESLVAFADFGDVVTVAPATRDTLRLTGPFAQDLGSGSDNLVNRARALMPGPFWTGKAIRAPNTKAPRPVPSCWKRTCRWRPASAAVRPMRRRPFGP